MSDARTFPHWGTLLARRVRKREKDSRDGGQNLLAPITRIFFSLLLCSMKLGKAMTSVPLAGCKFPHFRGINAVKKDAQPLLGANYSR